jgi:protein gp37
MGKETNIEWCDSSLNIMMGCDGCELWTKKVHNCYAGTLTERYGGAKGWPVSFDKPAMFPERLQPALRWPDLTGTTRPDKPWLNGRPRHIFLDDMGDTFTESLPLMWLEPHLIPMAMSPHVYMFLTKRPKRMYQFFDKVGYIPNNFMLGTSVTDKTTVRRLETLRELKEIYPDTMMYASVEPLIEGIEIPGETLDALSLVIIGGESGQNARPFNCRWARQIILRCVDHGISVFVKQLGSRPYLDELTFGEMPWMNLKDKKGGAMEEWPVELRVRQFPQVEIAS